jgi:hypothetical protein
MEKNMVKNMRFGKGRYIKRATRIIAVDKGTPTETKFRETG